MEKHLIIFTDGASRGNPGPGGWGVIVSDNEFVTELGGGESHTTNNRMELQAVIGALEYVQSTYGQGEKRTITVYADSRYVLKGVSGWLVGWQANGWQTKAKTDVINRDLWEKMATILEKIEGNFTLEWKHVGGHVGIPGNERVDEIATAFADGDTPILYSGKASEYSHDLSITEGTADKKDLKKKKSSDKPVYSYVSLVDGEVKTHKTWAECEKRVKGVSKAKFQKVFSAAEEYALVESYKNL